MTKEEFMVIAKTLKAVYTDPKFLPDMDALNVWYMFLQDLDYQTTSNAVAKFISTSKWSPTVADIRQMAVELTAPPEDSLGELEAWALVQRAIRNGTYGAEKEFEALPPLIQKAVGDPSNLREWAQTDEDTRTVLQSQFQKVYRSTVQRAKEEAQMPVLDTMKQIGGTQVERIGLQ